MMLEKKPIHLISKELGIDAKKVIKVCNEIGIYAKGVSKRLDKKEEEQIRKSKQQNLLNEELKILDALCNNANSFELEILFISSSKIDIDQNVTYKCKSINNCYIFV